MPIDYSNYCKDWHLRSRFIRFYRANNKCEGCGLPNHVHVEKNTRELCLPDEDNAIRIVLTVAHLDHNINNNSFFNLKALCQKCHNSYDAKIRAKNRKKKMEKNQLEIPLLSAEEKRDAGIKQAVDHADAVNENWSDRAYEFLVWYAKNNPEFMAEDVRQASVQYLEQPPHDRAWGAIIVRAKKNKIIKSVGFRSVKNRKAHCTPAAVWRAIKRQYKTE